MWINTVIVVSAIQLANGAGYNNYVDQNPIIFPGPVQNTNTRHGDSKGDSNDPCGNLTYCNVKPDDYPQELFDRMFRGKYKEPIFQPTFIMTDNRQGDPSEQTGCESLVTYDPLYKVRNKRGEWRTVVQAPKENYLQLVRMETCDEERSRCFKDFEPPEGEEAFCKQTYGRWEFLVYNNKDGTERFEADLPICCTCHHRKID